jgi:hypothetical protein
VVLSGEAVDAEHLDHGYALTVHREQGATADCAHVLAEGGGRQLAYVAMSRARHRSTVHTVADSAEQAVETITDDWTADRDQPWLTPSTEVGEVPRTQPAPAAPGDGPPEHPAVTRMRQHLDRLQQRAARSPNHEPPAIGL